MKPLTATPRTGALQAWRQDLSGALSATAAMLPFVLTYGLLAYGAAGAAAAQAGLTASVLSVVLGAAVLLVFSRAPLPTAAPSASTSLILGSLVLVLVQDPQLNPAAPAGLARLLACTGATVATAGLLMVLMGALRLGRLVRFVPQPVLAGYMNGVAVLIGLSQVPVLLGLSAADWARDGWAALAGWQLAPLLVALLTALLVGGLARRWPRAPTPLLALVVAGAAAVAVQAQWPALSLPAVGSLQARWPLPDVLLPLLGTSAAALLQQHGLALLTTALLLALIGALESVLSLAAMDQLTGHRTDPDRELRALGAANVVMALFGGLFLVYLRLRALSTWQGGGRGPRAVLLSCACLVFVFTLGLPLVQRLPAAVVAGVVVMLAWTLVDRWTRQLVQQWWRGQRSTDLVLSLGVVAAVCGATVVWGFAVGAALGTVLAMLILVRLLQRSLLRLGYSAADIPSRRIYPPTLQAALQALRPGIRVLELEGALFFGNAEHLQQQVERLQPQPDCVVLDLRRVSSIDASGAMALAQLEQRLQQQGTALLLAGVTADNRHGLALREQGAQGAVDRCGGHADADRAIEAAETAALARAGLPLPSLAVAPEHSALMAGLSAEQAARLCSLLQPRLLRPGERLFAQGDAPDALYLLARGSVSVTDPARVQRYVTFSPGMCFGETAVLDGGGRTADAVADTDCEVFALPAAALADLQRSDPAIAAQVYLNLARHLSERLRAAAAAWHRAAA